MLPEIAHMIARKNVRGLLIMTENAGNKTLQTNQEVIPKEDTVDTDNTDVLIDIEEYLL